VAKATKPSQQKLGKRLNKSEWIRRQPVSMTAKDVVAKAKDEGISLSLAQVYSTRYTSNKPGKKTNGHSNASPDVRQDFVRLAMRLGTDEAQRLLTQVLERQA
jgi:hypothetical protein